MLLATTLIAIAWQHIPKSYTGIILLTSANSFRLKNIADKHMTNMKWSEGEKYEGILHLHSELWNGLKYGKYF